MIEKIKGERGGEHSIRAYDSPQSSYRSPIVEESKAWGRMFNKLHEISQIDKETLNSPLWREFFRSVEEWGHYEYLCRVANKDKKKKCLFWRDEVKQ